MDADFAALETAVDKLKPPAAAAGAKPPAHLALVLDLATQMSEDMVLMLEAGQLQGRVVKTTRSNVAQVGTRLHAIKVKIARLDSQVQMLIAKKDLIERTA